MYFCNVAKYRLSTQSCYKANAYSWRGKCQHFKSMYFSYCSTAAFCCITCLTLIVLNHHVHSRDNVDQRSRPTFRWNCTRQCPFSFDLRDSRRRVAREQELEYLRLMAESRLAVVGFSAVSHLHVFHVLLSCCCGFLVVWGCLLNPPLNPLFCHKD